MKHILLIVITIIATVLSSCLNSLGCKKVTITEEEKEWLKFATLNDTFLFKSNINSVDTFVVTFWDDNNFTDCNRFEKGENQYEYNSISMRRINKSRDYPAKDSEALFIFEKSVNNQSDSTSYKRFTVFDFRTDGFANFADFPLVNLELSTTKTSYTANLFDRSGVHGNKDGSPVFIKSFLWSKENGLLKYETASGEVFEFLKKF